MTACLRLLSAFVPSEVDFRRFRMWIPLKVNTTVFLHEKVKELTVGNKAGLTSSEDFSVSK